MRIDLHGRRVGGWIEALDVEAETEADRLRPLAKVSSAGPPAEVFELATWAAWRWAGPRALTLRAASPPRIVTPIAPPQPDRRRGTGFTVSPTDDETVEEAARAGYEAGAGIVEWPPGRRMAGLLRRLVAREGSTVVILPDARRIHLLTRHLREMGQPVWMMSSEQAPAELARAWSESRRGRGVVVGGRTAVWAPVPDLAAVVVVDDLDEGLVEERAPTWHAREVARERARRSQSRFTVVSPAPSVEAREAARVVWRPRAEARQASWSRFEVVDRKEEPPQPGILSEAFVARARRGAERGRVVCVVNRKGRSTLSACAGCGDVARCDRCGSSVAEDDLGFECRRCGERRPVVCIECGATRFKRLRAGVSRLREEVEALLPRAPVVEVPGEEPVPERGAVVGTEAVLHRVEAAEMVAFLDFDQELLAPRFRASEQALWLLVRAARLVRETRGTVLVQSRLVGHEVLRAVAECDVDVVARAEEERRRLLGFPPYGALAEASGAPEAVTALVDGLAGRRVEVLGPAAAGARLRALLRSASYDDLCDALAETVRAAKERGRLRVDVDPQRA